MLSIVYLVACGGTATFSKGALGDVEEGQQPADDAMEQVPGAEDSGSDTDTDTADTGAVANPCADDPRECGRCDFAVETTVGDVVMYNTLRTSLSITTPTIEDVDGPGFVPVLAILFRADSEECVNLTLTGMTFAGWWTDYAETGWKPSRVALVDEVSHVVADGTLAVTSDAVYAGFDATIVVTAGTERIITVWADLSDASAEKHDLFQFRLYVDSLGVDDGYESYVLRNEEVKGNTLGF